jgi:hypothetical protein
MLAKETDFKESAHGKLKWFKIDELGKEKVIPSDLWLIKNKLESKIDVKNAYMMENQGELSAFKILH